MNQRYPSLLTADTESGLRLASQLAERLQAEIARSQAALERPGGMNYLPSASLPRDAVAGILFYAIAAANQGWTGR